MEWISVKEKNPNDDEHVLVFDRDYGICLGYRCYESWQHYPLGSYAGDGCLFDVTHWMPLPESPKEYKVSLGKHDFPTSMISTEFKNG